MTLSCTSQVEALRTVVGAQRSWAQYTYGSTGRHAELASMIERIDFGPVEKKAEGMIGGSQMWRMGPARCGVRGDKRKLTHATPFSSCDRTRSQLWPHPFTAVTAPTRNAHGKLAGLGCPTSYPSLHICNTHTQSGANTFERTRSPELTLALTHVHTRARTHTFACAHTYTRCHTLAYIGL